MAEFFYFLWDIFRRVSDRHSHSRKLEKGGKHRQHCEIHRSADKLQVYIAVGDQINSQNGQNVVKVQCRAYIPRIISPPPGNLKLVSKLPHFKVSPSISFIYPAQTWDKDSLVIRGSH